MKKKVSSRIKKFISCNVAGHISPSHSTGVDVREEYAKAFRTESYIDFWTNVMELSDGGCSITTVPIESTTAARLPSYRLFSEYLLDPDQPTITRILTLARNRSNIHTLLSDYFAQTANASILCGLLLKDIERTRVKYHSFKTTLKTTQALPINSFPKAQTQLTGISNYSNPFISPMSSPTQVRSVQSGCSILLQRLESSRNRARAKIRLINKLKHGSALAFVAIITSLTVIIVTHALSLLVAVPTLVLASKELASSKKLARVTAQLDAAAKGTYILSRDLDTISHLVARLNDELEHISLISKFWLERKDQDWPQKSDELARQLNKNECSFSGKLDELEEHLYLCFMTINRARKIVVREIANPVLPNKHHCILLSN